MLFSHHFQPHALAQAQVTSTLCVSSFAGNHGAQGYVRSKEGSSPQKEHEGHEGKYEV